MNKVSVARPNRIKPILIWITSIAALFLILFFVLPFFVKPAALQDLLSRQFREKTSFDIELERPSLSLLPLPTFRFHNIEIRDPNHPEAAPFLTLEEFRCQLRILPLFARQIDLSKVIFRNANLKLPVSMNEQEAPRIMEFNHVTAILSNVRSNHWMNVELSGNWLSDTPNLFLEGKAKIDFDHPDPAGMSWNGQITVKTTPLRKSLQQFGIPVFELIDSGSFAWDGKLEKTAASPEVTVQGVLGLDDFIYRMSTQKTTASEKTNYKLDLNAVYDINTQLLTFKPTTVSASFLSLKISGAANLKEGKAEEIHLALDPITWDRLPNYILPLAEVMPVNLGFSGSSRLDIVISGTQDNLAIHANGDLTDSLFAYSRYFEKPKSVPFQFTSDHLSFKEGRILDGEVDITLNQTKLKGSFVKFDTTSGLGEITLMTNQFDLPGWEAMVPTMSGYELSGALKLFVNVKNKTKADEQAAPAEPRLMYNVAFDNVGIREKSGAALIENLSGSIDAGPMDLEAKKFSFQIGGSQFSGQAAMFFQEVPRIIVNLDSPALDLRAVIQKAGPIARIFGVNLTPEQLLPVEQAVGSVIKPNVKLENLVSEFGYENNRIALKSLSFQVYEGSVRANGWLDLNPPVPPYGLDLEIEKISLARMLETDLQSPIEGNLFLVAQTQGRGFSEDDIKNSLTGSGTVSLTNGDLKTVDLLGSMAIVAQLAGLNEFSSGHTRFEDIKSEFRIGGGKITTDQLLLHSADLSVDAAGDIDFQGNLNFRLQTSLSHAVSRKIKPSIEENERIGPIPLILTGTLQKPSLKPDPALIQNFVINLAKEKFQKFFQPQESAEKAGDLADSKTEENGPANPLAELMRQDGEKKSNSERAVQTGMALLESLLKKPE